MSENTDHFPPRPRHQASCIKDATNFTTQAGSVLVSYNHGVQWESLPTHGDKAAKDLAELLTAGLAALEADR